MCSRGDVVSVPVTLPAHLQVHVCNKSLLIRVYVLVRIHVQYITSITSIIIYYEHSVIMRILLLLWKPIHIVVHNIVINKIIQNLIIDDDEYIDQNPKHITYIVYLNI